MVAELCDPKNSLGYSLTRVNGKTWGSLETASLHLLFFPLGGLVLTVLFLVLAKSDVVGHISLSRRLAVRP